MYDLQFTEPGIGQISIDEFKESFHAELSFWAQPEYEAHWKNAAVIVSRGQPACFITSITDPKNANFIMCWACYPQGNILKFQERIIFLEELEEPFSVDNPHKHILPYEQFSEDGDKISEWETNNEIKI